MPFVICGFKELKQEADKFSEPSLSIDTVLGKTNKINSILGKQMTKVNCEEHRPCKKFNL